jgi:hypothetical protein
MQASASADYFVVDLTEAIALSRFLTFCRHWFLLLAFAGAVWIALYAPLPSIASIAGTFALAYLVVSYPRRGSLLVLVWLLLVSAPLMALWGMLKFIESVRNDFTFELLIPIGVIVAAFWVSWRVLRRPDAMTDGPDDSGFTTMDIGKGASSSQPSFLDTWCSGGWRSGFVLGIAWTLAIALMEAKAFPSCFYLALSFLALLVMPWVLVPVRDSLHNTFALPLVNLIGSSQSNQRKGAYVLLVMRRALRHPLALIWLLLSVLAFAVAIAAFSVALSLPPRLIPDEATELRLLAPTAVIVAFAASIFCLRLGRGHALREFVTEEEPDAAEFILYLRSFLDDQAEVLRDGLLFRVWIVDPFLSVLRFVRFEEILAKAVWPFGKLLALNRPGEDVPQLGALRIDVTGDWQETIESLVPRAKNLLMTVGFTSGLQWEFRRLAGSMDLTRLTLVIPPAVHESILSTWHQFASNSPQLQSCPDEVVARSLAVRFTPEEGRPIFLTANRPSVAAYQLALNTFGLPLRALWPAQPPVQWQARLRPALAAAAIVFVGSVGHYLVPILGSLQFSTPPPPSMPFAPPPPPPPPPPGPPPFVVRRVPGEASPRFEPQRFDPIGPKVLEFSQAEGRYAKKYKESKEQLGRGELSAAAFEAILEGELLPAIGSQRAVFSKLVYLDPADQHLADDVLRYISIREEGWNLLLTGLREDNSELLRAAEERERSLEPLAVRIRAEYGRVK